MSRPRRILAVAASVVVAGATVLAVLVATGVWPSAPPALETGVEGTVVVVRTAGETSAYLEYGPTAARGLFTAPTGPSREHRFDLAALAPGRYHVRAVALAGGETLTGAGLVVATPPGPRFHVLAAVDDHLELDGRPWFPRFTWGACASDYPDAAAAGVNAFMSSNCGDSPERQARAARKTGAVVIPALDQLSRALPTTVATYLRDEPDLAGVPPHVLAVDLASHPAAQGLPVFETLSRLAASAETRGAKPYDGWASLADCLGIDVYPIYNTGEHERIAEVAAAQRELQALAGGKPTFQWIEATSPEKHPDWTPEPREVEAEAWMAVVNGARALGWWTHGATAFAVTPANRRALGRVGAALDTFAPVLAAPRAGLTLGSGGVDAIAAARDGALYVFAVNTSPTDVVLEDFQLEGLAGRAVRLWGTATSLAASGDSFTDTLPPLAWRVYVVPPL